jgi:hypothetical protein
MGKQVGLKWCQSKKSMQTLSYERPKTAQRRLSLLLEFIKPFLIDGIVSEGYV